MAPAPVLVAVVLLCLLAVAGLRWTPPGQLLVVSRRGVVRRVVGRGPAWRWPLLDAVELVPVGSDPVAVSVRATTRDGHEVRLLAEAALAVVPPSPGARSDAVARARADAEDGLAEALVSAVADCDVADLEGLRVGELSVVELDVVLR